MCLLSSKLNQQAAMRTSERITACSGFYLFTKDCLSHLSFCLTLYVQSVPCPSHTVTSGHMHQPSCDSDGKHLKIQMKMYLKIKNLERKNKLVIICKTNHKYKINNICETSKRVIS